MMSYHAADAHETVLDAALERTATTLDAMRAQQHGRRLCAAGRFAYQEAA